MRNIFKPQSTIKKTTEDQVIDILVYFLSFFLMVVTIYPFLNVIAISLNDSADTMIGGITIFPRVFTTVAYRDILGDSVIYSSAFISVLRTVIGTSMHIVCVVFVGYLLSRKDFVLVKQLTVMMTITMYVGGGLIPHYFVLRSLGLINSFWVYIIPGLFVPFHVLICRTYIYGIPNSLFESARIDGASDFTIVLRLVFPLCVPVIATVALFSAVGHWNSWFDTYVFASGNKSIRTLQFMLMLKLQSAQMTLNESMSDVMAQAEGNEVEMITPRSIRAAMTMVAAIPIIIVYPFLQRYFVSGMMIGGVKG